VPVATARALANDAFLRVLVKDGTDITAVSGLGRSIPTRLKAAVRARDKKCGVWGCEARDHLQIDHIIQRTDGGPHSLANLWLLCPHHHYLKTYRGYRVVGKPGRQTLVPPEEKTEAAARGP
jgi:5-methylcytosine-specific restriction endonuclease McrA